MKKMYLILIIILFVGAGLYLNRLVSVPVMSGEYSAGIITENVVNDGENMGIELRASVESDKVKVLGNGKILADFVNGNTYLNFNDNILFEIDGTKEKEPFEVEIIGISGNGKQYLGNKKVVVQGDIVVLDRFLMN